MVKQCQLHGISSIPETTDEGIAKDIASMERRVRVLHCCPPYGYLTVELNDRPFKFVRQIEMARSEKALASFLAQAAKTNEHIYKKRVEGGMRPDIKELDATMESVFRFIREMYNDGRQDFCFRFGREWMTDQWYAFSEYFLDFLANGQDP